MALTIGSPVPRTEDPRLLTGRGRFSDDFALPGQVHAAMVRSDHAHARIVTIDAARARTMPGVLAVLTGADCAADGLAEIEHKPFPRTRFDLKLTGPGGTPGFIGEHPLLPTDKTRYVGEALAMVVARTKAEARDAAEAVAVECRPLAAVTETRAAAAEGAPLVWEERPDNVPIETWFGDRAATDAAFAGAAHVFAMRFDIGRVTGVPLEPRAALAAYDRLSGRITIYAGSGGAVRQKHEIAQILRLAPDRLRVVSFDVGGNFGTRNRVYPEFALVAWAARKLDRLVKYTAERRESFLSDYQGRDLAVDIELALAADGTFLALRAANLSNVGARIVSLSPLSKGSGIVTGPYAIPVASLRSRATFSNTPPTQAYRSSGRPEVVFALERLIDQAADALGLDPVALRRRNLVPAAAMPYTNAVGMPYDSGEYEACLDRALALADWDGFEARHRAAARRGRRLGRSLVPYVESSIGTPHEQARISVRPEGLVEVVVGTQPSGQGHETSFAQVAAERLGIAVGEVRILLGDTDVVQIGGGSHSGRSMRMAGTVIVEAAAALIALGRKLVAHLLEAAEADIEYRDGRFQVVGTDRGIGLFELAAETEQDGLPPALTDGLDGRLAVVADAEMHQPVFPNGCHVAEVEVDPETGSIEITRYAAVDDVGRVINPMIVDGQVHGGIVQGIGQAMSERCFFAPDSGQPLAASLLDYALPRADQLPFFETYLHEVPSPTNPLGVKAAGEGGTTPAPAAIVNAVVDALRELDVGHIEMPLTPYRVWQAIREAERLAEYGPTTV